MSVLPFTITPTLSQARERDTAVSRWGPEVKRILCIRLDRLGDTELTVAGGLFDFVDLAFQLDDRFLEFQLRC